MKPLSERYGQTALITGASSGIGKAFARTLASQGIDLVLVARRTELLEKLSAELSSSFNCRALVRTADLSKAEDIEILFESLGELEIDMLISNAGFGLKGAFEEDDLAKQISMVNTNAIAPLILSHRLLPAMKARGRGAIIFTGSIEGETGFPWSTSYAATKAFVHQFGGGLWAECRGTGVDVLVLSPGSTDTDAPRLQGIRDDQLVGVMSPEHVAEEALAQLGKRPLWIPGWHNRFFIGLLRILPRALSLKMAGMGMKRAIDNSKR
ncbi:MAG: short-subunit dehydrogenase [Bermanella sp.]|jgi:short-subunit dehydrogenase